MANHSESTSNEVAMPQEQIKLPRPHRYMSEYWDSNYLKGACEKSRAALNGWRKGSSRRDDSHELSQLIDAMKVENLFLIGSKRVEYVIRLDYAMTGREWEWGSRDIMLDLGAGGCPRRQQRLEYLMDAAKFSGGSVYLLNLGLTNEEKSAWLEAAAGGEAGPKSLLITNYGDKIVDFLKALQESKGLRNLSLQLCAMADECVQALSGLSSLTSLHLYRAYVSPQFVTTLAGLHGSPLAASLQRLSIQETLLQLNDEAPLSLGVFLRRWLKLKDLTLTQDEGSMAEEVLRECMEALSQSMKDSTSPLARFYSLSLGPFHDSKLVSSRTTVGAIVDALSESGLPFLELVGVATMDPAVEAQLLRNQRLFMLGGLEKVKATSMRLFICGDPYAGKTTLLSTMRSILAPKRDKVRTLLTCGRYVKHDRTQGIHVQAMRKGGILLSTWDMAGQKEFHAFHDCMFPDIGASSYQAPSMFMFVWNPINSRDSRRGEARNIPEFAENFRYWLKFLASKRRQSNVALKVVVVITRADQTDLILDALKSPIDSFRSDFKEVIEIAEQTFVVDARKKDRRVNEVLNYIFDIAAKVLRGVQVYDICTQVSEHLSKHLKMSKERIITWSEFSKICIDQLPILADEAKLQTVALTLNESGVIIYVNNVAFIVLDPDWFCHHIMGSLVYFPKSKLSTSTLKIQGFTDRGFLEKKLELITKCKVNGSLLVDLMEAMHLCCRVPADISISNKERIFIPATLTDVEDLSEQHLQWRLPAVPCTSNHNTVDYAYMGRRLECENKDLTFLTPGLFPRIQVLFTNAFQDDAKMKLGKDFIHIFMPLTKEMLTMEIMVVFCKGTVDNVIDVLIRALTNGQEDKSITLAYVQNRIIDALVKVCAQPNGIQGIKLIESVIRPEALHDPSMAQNREDHCLKMEYLKQVVRENLEQGRLPLQNQLVKQNSGNAFIDLIGYENYMEEVKSYKAWLGEAKDNELQDYSALLEEEDANELRMIRLDSKKADMLELQEEHQVSKEGVDITQSSMEPVRAAAFMEMQQPTLNLIKEIVVANLKEILRLHKKLDEMNKKLMEIHEEVVGLRSDVLTTVTKLVGSLSKFPVENELGSNNLPRYGFFTTEGVGNTRKLVASFTRHHLTCARIELLCEGGKYPHQVEDQPGITIYCQSEELQRAIPYVNFIIRVLAIAAKVGINMLAPSAALLIPDHWPIPQFKVRKLDNSSSSDRDRDRDSRSIIRQKILEASKEWQVQLASVLADNDGLTDDNIDKKFRLKRATYEKTTHSGAHHVAWLCHKHYEEHRASLVG